MLKNTINGQYQVDSNENYKFGIYLFTLNELLKHFDKIKNYCVHFLLMRLLHPHTLPLSS